jgi:hypothetical protein
MAELAGAVSSHCDDKTALRFGQAAPRSTVAEPTSQIGLVPSAGQARPQGRHAPGPVTDGRSSRAARPCTRGPQTQSPDCSKRSARGF